MRSNTIVDSRLLINHSLDHTLRANSFFLINSENRAHLAFQLLLYDKVVIPTKDFGIIPILINWFGLKGFERALKEDAINFFHKPSLLGYAGNGIGISGFVMEPSEERHFEWWQEALFGDMTKAIDIQLKVMCPFIGTKQKNKLLPLLYKCSKTLVYDNNFFNKYIVHETYTDIMRSSELSASLSTLARKSGPIDLTKVPGIDSNQMKVSNTDPISTPADLILRIAEINMAIIMGEQFGQADVFTPHGAESLLKAKLARAKATPTALENFLHLLDLENIPDPSAAVKLGELSLEDIWKIRRNRNSRKFRKWLREADLGSGRDLEKIYVRSLGQKSFYSNFPMKAIRFAVTKAADAVLPGSGTVLEVGDSFFIEKWVKGYTPKLFLDNLRNLDIYRK